MHELIDRGINLNDGQLICQRWETIYFDKQFNFPIFGL